MNRVLLLLGQKIRIGNINMLFNRNVMYIFKLKMKIVFIDLENIKQEINKKLYML